MISVDIELVYYLTSKEYYLPLIKKVHYQIKEKGEEYLKDLREKDNKLKIVLKKK